jgi:hypothetical protein
MLTFKSTPHCEPNSKSSPTPELLEERGLIFIILYNSQSLTVPFKNQSDIEHHRDELRKAGLN